MDTEDKASGLLNFLSNLGLEAFYPNKLTLQFFLDINKSSTHDGTIQSVKEIPWCFLRRLFKINVNCRDCTRFPPNDKNDHDDDDDFLGDACGANDSENGIYPLDLIVALFLCADSFLQQEMALKMSMCQFSVPLLLPFVNDSQCGLMLWALRDIVKEWCPQYLSDSPGIVEDNIVQANIPLYSFVRLKNCSLSKSQLLNQILSHGQQNHNVFFHRDMEGGGLKRKIADGLVEVCWYLPSGRKNLDLFPQPVTFANLRGDIYESLTQFSFLYKVSAATFVFLDKVEENEQEIFTPLQDLKSKLFLVVNKESAKVDITSVKMIVEKVGLPNSNIKGKDQRTNVAELKKKLCSVIENSLNCQRTTTSIVGMSGKAVELGLFVNECRMDIKEAVEEIVKGIEGETVPVYKKQQLPLQGENWKKLSQLEKEQCRMKNSSDSGLEKYKCLIKKQQDQIKNEQTNYPLSKGMKTFIDNIRKHDKEERHFFLKWMKLELDTLSRNNLSALRKKFKEEIKKKNAKRIAELDQALLDSSLGIEHYMREMGLIYEFSLDLNSSGSKVSDLPSIVAEMLLDGYPLELLDGDASNIAQRWVTDVLMELHKKVGGKSRLLVLTVLGVQSTGKSTLLNTMFGVQFPVSSGRCTRGAYMVFLRVGEDLKTEMNYDFIVLIDTEGLKSPHMAKLEDSYEHDNELATFVTGLSDVTIVNVSMENSTEMKDVLQITAHAFLRMRKIGKKPVCHFVHQNVAAVSALSKCLTERKSVLDHLNEMTRVAAEMEKQPSIEAFTDVLDYDIEKNNWNIPGLWHGTPPMAPVNTGYSEAVASLKKNLLETIKSSKHSEATQIPEFLEWMRSLWRSVKHENFIFSFRNTLVANAYDNLCKEFSQWEWDFRKEILSWQKEAELEMLNADSESGVEIWNQQITSKKSEVSRKIKDQEKLMSQKLSDYYKRKDRSVNLIEKYKNDFDHSISSLGKEINHSVSFKLNCILELKISTKKAQNLQSEYRGVIEKQVMELLSKFKNSVEVSDERLTKEFENMWTDATLNVHGLPERDITGCVLMQLKKSFSNLKVNEELHKTNLENYGTSEFKVQREYVNSSKIFTVFPRPLRDLQRFTESFIQSCKQMVHDKVKTNEDYHESFTRELLDKIDQFLEKTSKNHKTNSEFEIYLKLYICGYASREFLQMHQQYLKNNNPRAKLEKYKNQYLTDFLDLYKKQDHCQRKATDFAKFCIKPAVEGYINRSLGVDIVEEVMTSCYSSRSYFQYNIQRELLLKKDFNSIVKYISNYEHYVKDWIFQHICNKMLENNTVCRLKNRCLEVILKKMTDAIEQASKGEDDVALPDTKESVTHFISNMHKYLIKDISFSKEDEKTILFQIQSTCHEFISSLKISVEDLKVQLQKEFLKSENISDTLKKLPVSPQEELFKRVFGCGQQCPFCKVPCEAGGRGHKQHHAAVHRPQGLGSYRDVTTEKLIETLCTTDVQSQRKFRNEDTNWNFHPYKEYTTYYPEWHIPPDSSIEASDYWKHVLANYNHLFADEYKAKLADVPDDWKEIKPEQALEGLKQSYNVK